MLNGSDQIRLEREMLHYISIEEDKIARKWGSLNALIYSSGGEGFRYKEAKDNLLSQCSIDDDWGNELLFRRYMAAITAMEERAAELGNKPEHHPLDRAAVDMAARTVRDFIRNMSIKRSTN
ncbi:MAG: hypothetical protein RI928_1684 [Pseudomonadota bacterium]|jgi:hypothetical protein